MGKKIIFLLLISSFFWVNCKKTQTSPAGLMEQYICLENGLSYGEAKKSKVDCQSGDEIAKLVVLMQGAGWDEAKIQNSFKYFVQGQKIVELLPEIKECGGEKLSVDFFVMPYCPYGVKYVIGPFNELLKIFKEKLNWQPYFIVSKDEKGAFGARDEGEFIETKRELCILNLYGKEKWLEYFNCFAEKYMTKNISQLSSCFKTIAIEEKKVNACMSGDMSKLLEAEYQHSHKMQAHASPTAVYNCNKKIVGAMPFEFIKPVICSMFDGEKPQVCNN